jgi:hypothetical protein
LFSPEQNGMIQNTGPGAAGDSLIRGPQEEAIFDRGLRRIPADRSGGTGYHREGMSEL